MTDYERNLINLCGTDPQQAVLHGFTSLCLCDFYKEHAEKMKIILPIFNNFSENNYIKKFLDIVKLNRDHAFTKIINLDTVIEKMDHINNTYKNNGLFDNQLFKESTQQDSTVKKICKQNKDKHEKLSTIKNENENISKNLKKWW